MSPIKITRVDLEALIDLRYEVLRQGLPREAAYFDGDREDTTVHLAALEDGRVIACASLMDRPWEGQPAMQLRGMAVDKSHRKTGVGKLLLDEAERVSLSNQIPLLWANAREPAVGFYQRMGWVVVSERFEIPTAGPHFKMIRRLGRG